MKLNKETRVTTPDGLGVIKEIECYGFRLGVRYGVLHDTYPANRIKGFYTNDILYYDENEVTETPLKGN